MTGSSARFSSLIFLLMTVTIICVTSETRHTIKVNAPDDNKVTIYKLTKESSDNSTATDISHTAVSSTNPVVSIIGSKSILYPNLLKLFSFIPEWWQSSLPQHLSSKQSLSIQIDDFSRESCTLLNF